MLGLRDLNGFGITGDDFAARVIIEDRGSDTRVTVDDLDMIVLLGVTGTGTNVLNQQDVLLA